MDFVFAFFILLGVFGLTHLNAKVTPYINEEFNGMHDAFPRFLIQCVNWSFSGSAWVFVIWLMGHGIGMQ